MKIIGIDYGTRRIGVAMSDDSETFASPLCVINTRDSLKAAFKPIVEENGVRRAVIGMPLLFDGSPGPLAPKVEKFATMMETWFGIETALWDERYTSQQADVTARKSGTSEDKGKRDMAAATVILQSYLDSLKSRP